MGNQECKYRNQSNRKLLLTDHEEAERIQNLFHEIRNNNPKGIDQNNFMDYTKTKIDVHLQKVLNDYFFGSSQLISFCDFVELYASIVRGSVDDKSQTVKKFLAPGFSDDCEEKVISVDSLRSYASTIIKSYFITQQTDSKEYKSWVDNGCAGVDNKTLSLIINYFLSSATLKDKSFVSSSDVLQWFSLNPEFVSIQNYVFADLYKAKQMTYNKNGHYVRLNLLPHSDYIGSSSFPSVLDLSKILLLNLSIPTEYRSQWRFLYSSQIHGESFSILMGKIQRKGPSIVIVRDADGYEFGGFASHSWEPGPKFTGDTSCFLFGLYPEIRFHHSTSFNNHYQYFNVNQQTLPNGLGMGGQFDYFGFWLSSNYGVGHSSESCSSYKSFKMLSKRKEFVVRHVEVWAVGPVSEEPDDGGSEPNKRVLRAHTPYVRQKAPENLSQQHREAKAILEMSGKEFHSHEADSGI